MVDRRIQYYETYSDDEYITIYFIAPVEYAKPFRDDADACEISVEFPIGQAEANCASVEVGSIVEGEVVEWDDLAIPYDEIEELISIGEKYSLIDFNTGKVD